MTRLAVLCLVLLAACSGGGGGGPDAGPVDPVKKLVDDLDKAPITDPVTLPTSGNARYDGFLIAQFPLVPGEATSRAAYVGNLTLSVDFDKAQNAVSGRARSFEDGGGQPIAGALEITSGQIYRDNNPAQNYTFDGQVAGKLTHAERGAYRLDAEIAGEFRGPNREGINGVFFGDVNSAAGQDIFQGSFAAEKQ